MRKLILTKDIITFWFKEISPGNGLKKIKKFDTMLLERAGTTVIKALNGQLDRWSKTSTGSVSLSYIIESIYPKYIQRYTKSFFWGRNGTCPLSKINK